MLFLNEVVPEYFCVPDEGHSTETLLIKYICAIDSVWNLLRCFVCGFPTHISITYRCVRLIVN